MFWYEDDIRRVEEIKAAAHEEPKIIFYGSSSIRLWKNLQQDFAGFKPLNLGFGGSTMASCIWFFNRVMKGMNPTSVFIYAGDNDLGDGRHPEEVFIFFKQMVNEVRKRFGDIPTFYISIKPSIKRFNIIEQIKFTNKIIEEEIRNSNDPNLYYVNIFDRMLDQNRYPRRDLFEAEGLHINEKGYQMWKEIIMQTVSDHNIKLL